MVFKKTSLLLLIALLFIPFTLFGSINISGTINNVKIALPPEFPPVGGVEIQFLGTTRSVITDANGEFTLNDIPSNSISGLKLTKDGYKTTYTQFLDTGENNVYQAAFIFDNNLYTKNISSGTAPKHISGRGDIVGLTDGEGVTIEAIYLDTGEPAGVVKYIEASLRYMLKPGNSTSTTDLGFFGIYNVEPGRPVIVKGAKAGITLSTAIAVAYPDALTLMSILPVNPTNISGIAFTDDGDGEEPVVGADIALLGLKTASSGNDGSFDLEDIPSNSMCVLKSSKTGFLDTYLYGLVESGNNDIQLFMVTEEMFEEAVGQLPQADKGSILIDSEISNVKIELFDDSGNQITPITRYYLDEEGHVDPELTSTEPDGGCIIINLNPGYYYLVAEKEGFEFPVIWVPTFQNGLTIINDLCSITYVEGLYKTEPEDQINSSDPVASNSKDVPIFRFDLGTIGNYEKVTIKKINFTPKGTGNISTSLSSAKLYYDSNNNGDFDTLAGVGTIAENKITFNELNVEVGPNDSNKHWELRFDFNGTPQSGETFGIDLLKNIDITSIGKTSGLDVTCEGDPIIGNLITIVSSPLKPINISPSDGATNVLLSGYKLKASSFEKGAGEEYTGSDIHKKTHWQIRKAENTYETPVVDEETQTPAEEFSPPIDLETGFTYYWRVKYQNGADIWSDWSDETWFTADTLATSPQKPNNVSPDDNSVEVSITPSLKASNFEGAGLAEHKASQWKITFKNNEETAFDSGRDTNNLIEIDIPVGKLNYDTEYSWQVRYQDEGGAWSYWSDETSFKTESVELGDINGDGTVNISDVILCLRMSIGLSVTINENTYTEYPDWLQNRADMNGTDGVNIRDVILVLRKSLDLD
ncbi:hypothetical protein M0P98_08850 [bacterium]|nr:hypothetical protein [bacterium]